MIRKRKDWEEGKGKEWGQNREEKLAFCWDLNSFKDQTVTPWIWHLPWYSQSSLDPHSVTPINKSYLTLLLSEHFSYYNKTPYGFCFLSTFSTSSWLHIFSSCFFLFFSFILWFHIWLRPLKRGWSLWCHILKLNHHPLAFPLRKNLQGHQKVRLSPTTHCLFW